MYRVPNIMYCTELYHILYSTVIFIQTCTGIAFYHHIRSAKGVWNGGTSGTWRSDAVTELTFRPSLLTSTSFIAQIKPIEQVIFSFVRANV